MRRFRTLQTTYERSSGTPIEQNKAGDFTIGTSLTKADPLSLHTLFEFKPWLVEEVT